MQASTRDRQAEESPPQVLLVIRLELMVLDTGFVFLAFQPLERRHLADAELAFTRRKTGNQQVIQLKSGGADGTRTRDPRRDRPVF